MFDLERFVADCQAAHAAEPSHKAVREVLARALQEPRSVLKGLGEPARAQIGTLHRSASLTILNVIWAPRMTIPPHNHHMWAVIGIYTGREDNIFWRRLPDGRVEAAGAQSMCERDAVPARARDHPLGDQPDRAPHRRDPHLRRRLLRHPAQRVGCGDARRGPLRLVEDAALL
jgi:hypothetical protein